MLYELYAENFALISTLRLNLGEGMNALTGETGAGKSLLIDAVSLLIGSRGSDSFIRSGEDKAVVEGVFLPPFPEPAGNLLRGAGFDIEDTLILRRELVRGGRSIARINGAVTNLSQLRELGRLLINIHGQSEHMLLLEEEQQLLLLDSFDPAIKEQLTATATAYQQLLAAKQEIKKYEQNRDQLLSRSEELHYIIDELQKAELVPGEDEELAAEANLLVHGEKLYQLAGAAFSALNNSGAAIDSLGDALNNIKAIADLDTQAESLAERTRSLFYEAEDLSREMTAYQERVNLDSQRLEIVEARRALISRLSKKYHSSIDELIAKLDSSRQELNQLEELSLSADSLYLRQQQAQSKYDQAAAKLTAARQQAAKSLSSVVTRELQMLSMPNAHFRVDLLTNPAAKTGNEHALFMICPNVGEPFQPVAKIASGGELSRIVLGLKVILSRLDFVPTLVFDEVDTGLSGKALVAVAQRIAMVGESAQALVVTHNAVTAAAAAHQVMLEKHEEGGRTVVAAHTLDQQERIHEIARMIAGDKAGEITLQQARDLLEKMSQPQLF